MKRVCVDRSAMLAPVKRDSHEALRPVGITTCPERLTRAPKMRQLRVRPVAAIHKQSRAALTAG